MSDEKFSEAGRKARFEQWEKYGADRLKRDLETDPFVRVGSEQVQDLAWEFVRTKEAERATAEKKPEELFTLKPNVHGVGVDLKEAGRRVLGLWKKKP